MAGTVVRRQRAMEKRMTYLPLIERLLESGYSNSDVVATLNEFAYRPTRGSQWNTRQLSGLLRRIQLDSKRIR